VLLINPFYPKDPWGSFGKHVLTPSLALTSIAAATPPSFEVELWDENLLQGPPPGDPLPEIVGITVHLTFARRAYELADWFRRRRVAVVLGGLHVTACPDEAALHADAVVIGDGVSVWSQVLRDLRSGRLEHTYRGSFRRPRYEEAPAPRRDLLPHRSFLTTSSLVATRGCHNRCDFCYLSLGSLHMPYQTRSVAQVADEIRAAGQRYSVFVDNNLGSDKAYLRELCRALRPLDHIWSAALTIDVTDDPGLVREMALAGCTGVFVGFESLSSANLRDSHKATPDPREYPWRIRALQDNGIQVNGSFVLGFDHDRPDVFPELLDWIDANRLECATLQILTPYPGTPLFDRLTAEGRILHRDWNLYDTAHAVFTPRHMSPDELERGYAWCYRRLFSHSSIWRRRPRAATALPAYFTMTYLYKRSNRLWAFLIRHRLVAAIWRPLVEVSRRRNLRFRAALLQKSGPEAHHGCVRQDA
jgi:radical SAM superfamily enzyme YgiQ (UPF0313 family)